jgi:16S rRNA (guanine527-N7)-methyltransferase
MTTTLDLARAWKLPDGSVERLDALLGLLATDPTAPTSVTDPTDAIETHLADSLAALELPEARTAQKIADMGSGAGFPGIPLAIALPGSSVALVESAKRKCEFLARAVAATDTRNTTIVNERVESWSEGLETHEVVTVRAVAPLAVLAEYAAPLLIEGGALIAWKGRRDPTEEAAAARAAAELGLETREPLRVQPFPAAHDRHLHVFTKIAPTPPRFPRRPVKTAPAAATATLQA